MSRILLAGLAGAVLFASAPLAADAGHGGGGGGGHRHGGGQSHHGHSHHGHSHHGFFRYRPTVYVAPRVYRPAPVVVHRPIVIADHCCHPQHCYVWVQPGDSLDAICLREYGDASHWQKVAEYNSLGGMLDTTRPLMLPSIYASGRMVASTAPAPAARVAVASAPPATPPIAQ